MEMVVRQPLECPPKPERLNAYEREVVANMLNSLSRRQPLPQITPRCAAVFSHHYRPGLQCAVTAAPPPYYPYPNLRWDTSHFKRTGGALKNNYIIHPEFVSESYPEYGCW
ncbi:PREDICTED: spermatid-specific manchette-related protein 1 isoform X2 [Elephantulus edwardii]|uniref:spermatid-specific manchette-related protein 1 isoform X2 n=1 Tax=Elephantulus edwardii TaxID=28737 RepID=UPI0003F0959F|nr:PREDICTED: spermatid-specific manchette-related protein 1 isoform X2 [Elephantulus edwardii]